MRKIFAPFIALPLVVAGLPVFAQSSPSADQIINSLRPSGNLVSGGTRGIRLGAPPPSVPSSAIPIATGQPRPPAHVTSAQAPQTAAPSANLTVNFASGSADLTPQAIQALNELGRALSSQDLAGYKFRIEGHTDTVGTPAYNLTLAKRRSDAVAAKLVEDGVSQGSISALAAGKEGLLVATADGVREPQNRRAEIALR